MAGRRRSPKPRPRRRPAPSPARRYTLLQQETPGRPRDFAPRVEIVVSGTTCALEFLSAAGDLLLRMELPPATSEELWLPFTTGHGSGDFPRLAGLVLYNINGEAIFAAAHTPSERGQVHPETGWTYAFEGGEANAVDVIDSMPGVFWLDSEGRVMMRWP